MLRTFLKWSGDGHIITQEPEEKHVTKVIVLLDKLSQPAARRLGNLPYQL
jgi:hypothetical protein